MTKTYLEIPGLGNDPLVDELLRILGEAEEKLAIGFQLVDRFHCFVDLVVKVLKLIIMNYFGDNKNKL
jgi:hypothetical protein